MAVRKEFKGQTILASGPGAEEASSRCQTKSRTSIRIQCDNCPQERCERCLLNRNVTVFPFRDVVQCIELAEKLGSPGSIEVHCNRRCQHLCPREGIVEPPLHRYFRAMPQDTGRQTRLQLQILQALYALKGRSA